jgi:asparagine synthase (glutamine-hydrolysing)
MWWNQDGRLSADLLDRMTDTLSHRWPDGRGVYRKDYGSTLGIGLGHRRLSIIDVQGGAQPQFNENRNVCIVFNGEIYNFKELHKELESRGHVFSTVSDTEVIVHLYEEYGIECLRYLRGMFAFVIWDETKRRLFFARDRLGQKPFVYYQNDSGFYFGSEIKVLFELPFFSKKLRLQCIPEYLTYGYVPHPHTAFEGVMKLPPAHFGLIEMGKLKIFEYWNPDLIPDKTLSQRDCEEKIRARLDESVEMQLRSDVPLGCFLSGGIDSTVITGACQESLQHPLNTFTMGFEVPEYDESRYASIAATHLRTNHRTLQISPDAIDLLQELVWLFDEPFADSSALPTYYLCKETRKHVKVALTGDGGDEAFAGYPRHATAEKLAFFDRMPSWLMVGLTSRFASILPLGTESSIFTKLRNRVEVLRKPFAERYYNWVSPFPGDEVGRLCSGRFSMDQVETASNFLSGLIKGFPRMSEGLEAMRADMFSYLPGDLLPKVDILSMAHGLECRSPFLDHLLIEDALKIPFRYLHDPNYVKPMLSRTFKKWVPSTLGNRPKMGFRVPLSFWFRDDQRDLYDQLLDPSSFCCRFLDPTVIRHYIQANKSGKWDYGDRLWALLFLEKWGKTHFG